MLRDLNDSPSDGTARAQRRGAILCRHCGSGEVRRSSALADKFLRDVYRCRACGRHFRAGLNGKRLVLTIVAIAALAGLLVLLAVVLYYGFSYFGDLEVPAPTTQDS